MSERLRHLEAAETYPINNGDPNGLINAAEGTLLWDYADDTLWGNTDGVTAWQFIGGAATPSGRLLADGVGGVAVQLLAAGAIAYAAVFLYTVRQVIGGGTRAGMATIQPNDAQILYTDGTDELTLFCSALGALSVQRTAGVNTFDVRLLGVWQ